MVRVVGKGIEKGLLNWPLTNRWGSESQKGEVITERRSGEVPCIQGTGTRLFPGETSVKR